MKKWIFCVIVCLAVPAFGTIANVQSNAKWTCTGTGSSVTCNVTFGSPTSTNNLIAVWTFWQSTSPYAAVVVDSAGNGTGTPPVFPSAVGPTLQSASNTSAQIFYAKKITGASSDIVTVTFTCTSTPTICASATIPSAGVVAVEYSGLDQNNPLDSVSAGYSTSGNPTSLLDSGAAAPANGNLLVFGGGMSDSGTAGLIASSPFAVVQKSGGSITEQMIVSASASLPQGNNTLQRAQACIGPGMTCSPTTTGNWLMQMAVFRDASWTVAGAWSPARPAQVRYADQFPGADCGKKIGAADSDLGANAGEIWVSNACGMTLASAVTLNANHTLRFTQGGNYQQRAAITLLDNSGIVGPPSAVNEDVVPPSLGGSGLLNPPVTLQQPSSTNLSTMIILMGQNIVLENFAVDGDYRGGGNNSTNCITTDNTNGAANNRGRLRTKFLTVEDCAGDDLQITSDISGNNQAIGAIIQDSAFTRARGVVAGGNGISVSRTTDVIIWRSSFELNAGRGIASLDSQGRVFDSDISNNAGGQFSATFDATSNS